ncbi:hypothetical protein ACHMW6_10495 [Pseudoduganella sp. UC29_106]|uniref:hypothetical protein n=1 Tax=Pseudoduganella sp. UC29_106 TaxID=3374553 RepID=UPI003756A085
MPRSSWPYDLSPTLRASYTLGWWQNDATRNVESYLRDAAGNPVYKGDININGKRFTVTPADFATSKGDLEHIMQGLSLKTHGRWQLRLGSRGQQVRLCARCGQSERHRDRPGKTAAGIPWR